VPAWVLALLRVPVSSSLFNVYIKTFRSHNDRRIRVREPNGSHTSWSVTYLLSCARGDEVIIKCVPVNLAVGTVSRRRPIIMIIRLRACTRIAALWLKACFHLSPRVNATRRFTGEGCVDIISDQTHV